METNLQPFFWKKVHNIIRQNKQGALLEFLFPNATDNEPPSQGSNPTFDAKIKTLQKSYDGLRSSVASCQAQVNSLAQQVERLQQKVIHLETLTKNSKYSLSDALEDPNDIKIIQQGYSSLRETSPGSGKANKVPYLTENEPKRSAVLSEIRKPTSQTKYIQSKSLLKHGVNFDSEHSKIDF